MDTSLLTLLVDSPSFDSGSYAASSGLEHQHVVGALKSLEADGYVVLTAASKEKWVLTDEGRGFVSAGSPEFRLFSALTEPVDEAGLAALFPAEFVAAGSLEIAKGKCMQKKWMAKDKATGKYGRTVRGGGGGCSAPSPAVPSFLTPPPPPP